MEIFHGGVAVFPPSSLSSSRYYRLIDGANLNTQPPQPSSLPAPFSSSSALEGHLRVMDDLKSLSIRQDRLKASGNANTHIFFFSFLSLFFLQEVKINSANSR